MTNLYIVDLDGTVCDCSHRLHHIQKDTPDWDTFHELCTQDVPIKTVIRVINAIERSYPSSKFLYLTGRMEKNRLNTSDWIGKNLLPIVNVDLVMRKDGDHRKDEVIKPELLEEYLASEGNCGRKYQVVAAFEDRPSMCRKWREMGFTVFQMNHVEF